MKEKIVLPNVTRQDEPLNKEYIIHVDLSEGEGFEPTYEEVMEHFEDVIAQTMTLS